jgi:hypothetical protein
LGVTGLSPVTVNPCPAEVGPADEEAETETEGPGEGVGDVVGEARTVVVTGAGPVGVGVFEHPASSAAAAPTATVAAAPGVSRAI